MIDLLSHHTHRLSFLRDCKPHHHLFIVFGLIIFFIFAWSNLLPGSIPRLPSYSSSTLDPISNSTLGFHKVFALALPDRKDRVHPLLKAANATNISLTVLNAVRDVEISPDSWPEGWEEEHHRGGELGCLVSHVRTWNKMISHNISSALILESDADWDLRLKKIMHSLPPAIQSIVDFPFLTITSTNSLHRPGPSPSDPYASETWDILWLGHCGSNHEGYSRIYSWNDSTVPPESREFVFDLGLQEDQHVPGTRALYIFGRTTCSSAYAISMSGARKLVKYFKEANENLDIQLSRICTGHADMICLGIWPQVFTAASTLSNIDHSGNGDTVGGGQGKGNGDDDDDDEREEELTPDPGPALQFSARVNAKAILIHGRGSSDWKAEWDTMWAVRNGSWEEVALNRTEAFR